MKKKKRKEKIKKKKEKKKKPNTISLSVSNILPFERQRKAVRKIYEVINDGSCWRKDVANQCFNFDVRTVSPFNFSRLSSPVCPYSWRALWWTLSVRHWELCPHKLSIWQLWQLMSRPLQCKVAQAFDLTAVTGQVSTVATRWLESTCSDELNFTRLIWLYLTHLTPSDCSWLIWPHLNAADCSWLIWTHLTASDLIWLHLTSSDCSWLIWPDLNADDSSDLIWLQLTTSDLIWLQLNHLTSFDCSWLIWIHLTASDLIRLHLTSADSSDPIWLQLSHMTSSVLIWLSLTHLTAADSSDLIWQHLTAADVPGQQGTCASIDWFEGLDGNLLVFHSVLRCDLAPFVALKKRLTSKICSCFVLSY